MKFFVFRNATLEPFFPLKQTEFSGYEDISFVPENAENFIWFYTFLPEISSSEAVKVAEIFLAKLKIVLKKIPEKTPFHAVLLGVPEKKFLLSADDKNFEIAAKNFNSALFEISRSRENFHVIAVPEKILNDVDWRFFFSARIPFSPKHSSTISKIFDEHFEKISAKNFDKNSVPEGEILQKISAENSFPSYPKIRKKCLVLDLDETLWGGILGEDGAGEIAIGGEYPGNALLFFQKKISKLADTGTLVAISSKNNERDVLEAFEKRREIALKLEKISAKKIDWRDKATHLREISKELNIGLDSFVFVDNSATERAWIKASLPEVAVPEFPKNAFELPIFFAELLEKFFRAETLTAEDFQKIEQYRTNEKRQKFAENCASFEEYLAALKIELEISCDEKTAFPRVAQLSQKTNQFNLANRRLNRLEIENLAASGARIYTLFVRDIFGESGISGAAIVEKNSLGNAEIFEFLLSCRVLGRGIENAFLNEILLRERALGNAEIFAEFVPSQKNFVAKNFYPLNGFVEISPNKFSANLNSRADFKAKNLYTIFSK